MKQILRMSIFLATLTVLFGTWSWAQEYPDPSTYVPTIQQIDEHKKLMDDPRPYLKDWGVKQVVPKSLWDKLTSNVDEMKQTWSDLVGFKAPDVVGKISPEIKPGKYTYKDLQQYPSLKALMYPDLYNRIKPGAPPFVGNIPEFEIIPTRQYYWSLPIAKMTKENIGKTKQNSKGYIITDTWQGGYPFPKPSGPTKAQQIMYNVEKRYNSFGQDMLIIGRVSGYDKNLRNDFKGSYEIRQIKLSGRALMEPYGWFDDRAKERKEARAMLMSFTSPRDMAGTLQSSTYYLDPNKPDNILMYLSAMRRIRKMTSSDTQDPIGGQDQIYDDLEGFSQKLSPDRYPYKYEVVDEREFLVIAPTMDGAEYVSSDGLEFRNIRLERRPLYVVKLTQLDPSYVYSYRLFYIDKETFIFYHVENYDQKGRLYRSNDTNLSWCPEIGDLNWTGCLHLMRDHIDQHSSFEQPYQVPVALTREDISLQGFVKAR